MKDSQRHQIGQLSAIAALQQKQLGIVGAMVKMNRSSTAPLPIVMDAHHSVISDKDFSVKLKDILLAFKKVNPQQDNPYALYVTQIQLKKSMMKGRLSKKEKSIVTILLANYADLASSYDRGETWITEHTIRQAAHSCGDPEYFTYDGVLVVRSSYGHCAIPMIRFFKVMHLVAGERWLSMVNRNNLEIFIQNPENLLDNRHIAQIMLNHFDAFAHSDMIYNEHFIDMSDIQRIVWRSDPMSFSVVTREGVDPRKMSAEEKKDLERWLERNNLDENGFPNGEVYNQDEAFFGYFDRFDRILSAFPDKPWLRQ